MIFNSTSELSYTSDLPEKNTILRHPPSTESTKNLEYLFDVSLGDLEQYASLPLPSMKALDMNVHLKCFIHELRTPISTISLGLELLANSISNPEQTAEIILDSRQSIQFIENILTKFAVIQDENPTLNTFEPFLFSRLFDDIQRVMRYQIDEAHDLVFTMEIDPSITHQWYLGDKHNLQHVIINLIKNAIKYRDKTHKNAISLHVLTKPLETDYRYICKNVPPYRPSSTAPSSTKQSFRTQRQNHDAPPPRPPPKQQVILSICDTNPHLSPNIKQHLFQMFNSTSGSGLGLYICKNIVELHGGTISHDFLVLRGNQFTIQLELDTMTVPQGDELSDEVLGNALKPTVILSFLNEETPTLRSSFLSTRQVSLRRDMEAYTSLLRSEASDRESNVVSADPDKEGGTSSLVRGPKSLRTGTEGPLIQLTTESSLEAYSRGTRNESGGYPQYSGGLPEEYWSFSHKKKGTYNVLIVDDSTINRRLMYKSLKQMDIFNDVFTVEDGKDAVQKVGKYGDNIDVILMDKSMPIMVRGLKSLQQQTTESTESAHHSSLEGYEAVLYLRNVMHYTKLIIGLTGYDDAVTIAEFLRCGANEVLIKPLKKKELVDYIHKFFISLQ